MLSGNRLRGLAMTIVTLCGSPVPGTPAGNLLAYVGEWLGYNGHAVQSLAVSDLPAEDLLRGRAEAGAIAAAVAMVAAARGVIIATPVYKAAYSGALKALIDLLPDDALRDKVVLPLAVGGNPAHQLTLHYALKPVLDAAGVQTVLSSLYVGDKHLRVRDDGLLVLDPGIESRIAASLARLLGALASPPAGEAEAPPVVLKPIPRSARTVRCGA